MRRSSMLSKGRRRPVSRPAKSLGLERLEDRQLMAGEVFFNSTLFQQLGDFQLADGGVLAPPEDPPPQSIPTVQEFNLHSKPGAPASLFLDFSGHFQEARIGAPEWADALWPGEQGWDHVLTPAFNMDSDPNMFSPSEQRAIKFIWQLVAEDYAPFNIDVTTVDPDPGNLHPERPYMRVVMSGEKDFRKDSSKGGFSVIGAYDDGGQPNVCYVFQSTSVTFMANAASHEAGHAFGLEHYGKHNGKPLRAPIMQENGPMFSLDGGATFDFAERGTFWDGQVNKIASDNGFGFRPDDHQGWLGGASPMAITNAGLFAHGIIEKTTDVDVFRFITDGGDVSIAVTVPQATINGTTFRNIGNLDPTLTLVDANGNVLGQDTDPSLSAGLSVNLPAGTYFVKVGSFGQSGDVGQYTVNVKENSGPKVASVERFNLSDTQLGLLVKFNEPINPYSFTAADVRINGGAAGAGVVSIGPPSMESTTFLVTLNKPGGFLSRFYVGPNVTDYFGNRMDQNQNNVNGETGDFYTGMFLSDVFTNWQVLETSQTVASRGVEETFAVSFAQYASVTAKVIVDPLNPLKKRLEITGDDLANHVTIELGADGVAGSVRVRAALGETLNGQFSPLLFEGINQGVTVELRGGDDGLTVNGQKVVGPITFNAGPGDDTYTLGTVKTKFVLQDPAGNDTLNFSQAAKRITVNLSKPTSQFQGLGNGNTARLAGQFENVIGSPFNDVIVGNAANNRLLGMAGDDKLSGGLGDDLLRGGDGNDSLAGNGGNDVLLGEAGNDSLAGGLGFDLLIGGLGKDKLVGGTKGNGLLIGGTTTFDNSDDALWALLSEWSSATPLAARFTHLTSGGGLNGGLTLSFGGTVADDLAIDSLKGYAGTNWFFKSTGDTLAGKKASDKVTS